MIIDNIFSFNSFMYIIHIIKYKYAKKFEIVKIIYSNIIILIHFGDCLQRKNVNSIGF